MTAAAKARMRQTRTREGHEASLTVALQSIGIACVATVPTKALPGGRSGLAHARRLHRLAFISKET